MTTPNTRTAAALEARRTATAAMLDRVEAAVGQLKRERAKISYAAVARRAAVSRTFLYQNAKACTMIREAAGTVAARRIRDGVHHAAQVEDSWRERALNAENGLTSAYDEINQHRATIAGLLGRIRDLEADLPEDGIQRLISDNTTLKAQLRQLTYDNQQLKDRLQGARDNNRFLDHRVAQLEARLADDPALPGLSVEPPTPPSRSSSFFCN